MKAKITLLMLLSLCIFAVSAQSNWTNYTNDRLISDVLVVGNNVWVGSQGGLTRTNILTGEFQTYLPGNSPIKGGGITDIEKAPDNSLWMASENAGIFHVKDGEWTNYYDGIIRPRNYTIRSLQVLPNHDVWVCVGYQGVSKMLRIRNGIVDSFGNMPENLRTCAVLDEHTIYGATRDTLYRYDATLEKVVDVYHAGNSLIPPDPVFTEIITDRNGNLIIPTEDNILQLKNGTISVLSTPGLAALKAFKDGVGNVYFDTYTNEPNGIRLVKYNGITVTYLKDVDLKPYPAADTPHFKGADREGKLFAVIWNLDTAYTLFRFDESGWMPVETQIYPLLDNYQEDVQSDCKGNLWFASRDGVDVRYADGTWEHFSIPVGQGHYFLSGQMTVDPITCDVWFANESNSGSPTIPGIIRISNGIITPFLMGHSNVFDVEATIDGKMYFFSANSGFGYIENDEIHYIDELDEIIYVFNIDSDSKGNVYVAAWDSTLIKYDGVTLTHLGQGEFTGLVYNAIVDNDDFVWVNYSDGVKLFDGVHWTNYSDVWPGGSFTDLVQDKLGNYWVSIWGEGLYYWDRNTLQNYTIFNSGLSTNSIRAVALDPDGNLIVTQHVGASVLKIPDISGALKGTGTVFFDAAKNGTFDPSNDILIAGQKVKDTELDVWAVTNSHGKYTFYGASPESHTYQHVLEPFAVSTTDNPQSADLVDYQSILPDFGFWEPQIPDVTVTIVNGIAICNRDFRVYLYLRNNSPYAITGHFSLYFNDLLTLKDSSIPYTHLSAGRVVFEDLHIDPFGVIEIRLDFTAPGLNEEGILLLFEGIFDTSDGPFLASTLESVVCSYDPNDKKVEPTGEFYNDYSLVADPLKYTIRFQNEGTYKAFDITIIDTLDQHLDPSTFELLASSHNVETTVTAEGIVTFVFRNIDLPARSDDDLGSQGFVTYTVKPDSNLVYERIDNKASIYFDFNPPIETNTTAWHVVDDLAIVSTQEASGEVSVYPNPTTGTLYLTMNHEGEYKLLDATGRHIDMGSLQVGSNIIHLDTQSGIYYLQVSDGSEVYAPVKVAVIR